MKYGARNQIPAVVTGVKKGQLLAQVNLKATELADLSSVMTLDSFADLNIREGDKVKLVVKAVNVLVVKE